MKFKPRTDLRNGIPDFTFECPGCKCDHGVWTTGKNPLTDAIWSFNGDINKPTVSPSLHVEHVSPAGKKMICHSFINGGKIQFLTDCTHELAGHTIELPELT